MKKRIKFERASIMTNKLMISLSRHYIYYENIHSKFHPLINIQLIIRFNSYLTYLIQHPMQFVPCLNNSVSVIAVHHKYKTLGVLKVVPPQRTDL